MMHVYIGVTVVVVGFILMGCAPSKDMGASNATETAAALTERTDLIPVGEPAPDFTLVDHAGETFHLAAHRGRSIVLVFYPKDETPGCTKQLCAVRNDWPQFRERGVVMAGVNPAARQVHRKFAEHHGFPFPLLSDEGLHVAAAYGCRGSGDMPTRTVYVIDPQGRVAFAERGMPSDEDILRHTVAAK